MQEKAWHGSGRPQERRGAGRHGTWAAPCCCCCRPLNRRRLLPASKPANPPISGVDAATRLSAPDGVDPELMPLPPPRCSAEPEPEPACRLRSGSGAEEATLGLRGWGAGSEGDKTRSGIGGSISWGRDRGPSKEGEQRAGGVEGCGGDMGQPAALAKGSLAVGWGGGEGSAPAQACMMSEGLAHGACLGPGPATIQPTTTTLGCFVQCIIERPA